ncbi:MAG: hypothetical protein L0K30_13810, partial [Acidipropionibacterium jensenii]|uniref:hypothetical protein n=1 Tax=Acidipropionibacterium jensenii TaxID=1749 RepID=UPI0026480FBB
VGRRKGQRALVPMFGGEGLCRRGGAPTGPQVGPIIYELSPALSPLPAVWSTVEVGLNVLCLRGDIADQVAANFDVAMVDVEWRGRRKGGRAKQLVPHVDSRPWYDPVVMAEYPMISGQIARVCPKCGTIAYLNNAFRPIKLDVIESSTEPIVCSPERFWFGRNTLMRRDMAEFIASVAKDDFDFRDLEVDGVDDGNFSPTPPPIPEGAGWCHSVEATLPVGGGLIGGVCGWRGWGCRSVTGRRSRRPRKRAGRCGGSPVTWGVARR